MLVQFACEYCKILWKANAAAREGQCRPMPIQHQCRLCCCESAVASCKGRFGLHNLSARLLPLPLTCAPHRCISGTRVVGKGKKQNVAGLDFVGYGSHCNAYPHVYLTAAAAIGTTAAEADEFAGRLVKAYREMQAKGRQQGRA